VEEQTPAVVTSDAQRQEGCWGRRYPRWRRKGAQIEIADLKARGLVYVEMENVRS
jgi:hypothetical protein